MVVTVRLSNVKSLALPKVTLAVFGANTLNAPLLPPAELISVLIGENAANVASPLMSSAILITPNMLKTPETSELLDTTPPLTVPPSSVSPPRSMPERLVPSAKPLKSNVVTPA